METNQIMRAHLLDIIFENRNKQYGAYALRMGYDNRLLASLGIMAAMVALLSVFACWGFGKEKSRRIPTIETTLYSFKEPKKTEKIPEKPKAVTPVSKKNFQTQKFVSRVMVINHKDSAADRLNNLDSNLIASVSNRGDSSNIATVGTTVMPVKQPGGGGNTGGNKLSTQPLITAEVMPSFPGGIEALRRFMERHLTTPADMGEEEQVEVRVRFVVGFDGKLQSFEIVKDGGTVFNDEVIRVMKKMPDWVPGRSNGEKVSVYFTMPVKFIATAP